MPQCTAARWSDDDPRSLTDDSSVFREVSDGMARLFGCVNVEGEGREHHEGGIGGRVLRQRQ